jgi:hypothetical protein
MKWWQSNLPTIEAINNQKMVFELYGKLQNNITHELHDLKSF